MKCPKCGSKAYVGLVIVECENVKCNLFKPSNELKVETTLQLMNQTVEEMRKDQVSLGGIPLGKVTSISGIPRGFRLRDELRRMWGHQTLTSFGIKAKDIRLDSKIPTYYQVSPKSGFHREWVQLSTDVVESALLNWAKTYGKLRREYE